MAANEPTRKRTLRPAQIPDKLYFRIGEVARLCDIPAYVLRFWESEFPQLKPNKGGTGQRLYRRRDVEMVLHIKRLLYDEGYTIPGARQVFKAEIKEKNAELPFKAEQERLAKQERALQKIRQDLKEILAILSAPVGAKQPASRPQTASKFIMPKPKQEPGLF
jgi:DNA-binding transcriptional MerR regulator